MVHVRVLSWHMTTQTTSLLTRDVGTHTTRFRVVPSVTFFLQAMMLLAEQVLPSYNRRVWCHGYMCRRPHAVLSLSLIHI